MSDKLLVSICCITYNHEKYIKQCLDGVLMQQTNFEFEVLIHDDASTDDTTVIIREFEKKYPNIVKPIYQTENQYSKGINPDFTYNYPRAKGKYIAVCEGDDYWTDPLKLQKQVDFLEENEDFGLVHTNYEKYYEESNTLMTHNRENYLLQDENSFYFKTGDLRTCTVLFRAKWIPKIEELFSQDFMQDAVIGDRPIFTMIASVSKIYFLNDITCVYRITSTSSASHFEDLYKYYNFLLKVTILNENLFEYLKLNQDKTELLTNRKFYKIVLKSKTSVVLSSILLLTSGLGLKYYKEYRSVILNKLRK